MGSLLRRWHRFHRRLLLHRRPLAAVLAGAAVLVGLEATAQAPPPTVPVWVAGRDLPSGTVLTPDDLVRAAFAPGTAPGALVPDEVRGRVVSTPLAAGEPVTRSHLVGPGLAHGRPGEVATPVRITDPAVVDLLRVGDRVDLVAVDPAGPGAAELVAAGATVLAVPQAPDRAVAGAVPGRLVVVSVGERDADTLLSSGIRKYLTVRWSG